MEISENKTRPWLHPQYSHLRHMYHPFLYHNHLYHKLKDPELKKLLAERDNFVKSIEGKLAFFKITEEEHDWLFYLRDCCLFEQHRRKYKFVLADILKLSRTNEYPVIQDLFRITRASSQGKVWAWLISIDNVFHAGDFQTIDEYPERLQGDISDLDELSHNAWELPQGPQRNLQFPENNQGDMQAIQPNVQYLQLSDDESDHREMLQPQLSESGPVGSPGRSLPDPEYVESQLESRSEIQLINERRAILLLQYKQNTEEAERKRKENEQKSLLMGQGESGVELGPHFVRNAIQSALNCEGSPQISSQYFAGQSSISQDGGLIMSWDEMSEAIDKINLDFEKNIRAQESLRFDTPPTASSTYSSESEEDFAFDPLAGLIPDDTWFTQRGNSQYIAPGVYLVPETSSNTHIRAGPFPLSTVQEEDEDNADYPHTVAIPQSYQEGATSITPPTVPTYIETDEEIKSSLASPLVPSRTRPASSLDDKSITSEDLQSENNPEFNDFDSNPSNEFLVQSAPPISHNTPEDASDDVQSEINEFDYNPYYDDSFVPLVPPVSHNTPNVESTISESEIASESEIDSMIPEAEPDFMNLPLPKTPDKENK